MPPIASRIFVVLVILPTEEDAFETELAFHSVIRMPAEPFSDSVYHQRILDSWQRIFDLDSVGDPDWLGDQAQEEKSMQGTFWQLLLNQLREITVFTSRRSR